MPFKLSIKFKEIKTNSTGKDTLWTFLGQITRLVCQAGYFVIIARTLGVENYGAFIGVSAFAGLLGPFAVLGFGHILVRDVARDHSLVRVCWGNALFVSLVSGILLTAAMALLVPTFLSGRVTLAVVILIAISDLICLRILETAAQVFQAVRQLRMSAQINALLNIVRLGAALALVLLFQESSITLWASLYLASTVIAGSIAFLLVTTSFGWPRLNLEKVKSSIKVGFHFSVGLSSQTVYNNSDKSMLASMATLEAAGIYAAAYRLIDVAFTPAKSLIIASYPKFFVVGGSGIRGSALLAKKLIPISFGYSLFAAFLLIVCAPIIPYILGNDFQTSVPALRLLTPLMLFRSIHYLGADSLTGADYQGVRSISQFTTAVLNVLANLIFIPLFSWKGAIGTSIFSDGLLMLMIWGSVFYLVKKQT